MGAVITELIDEPRMVIRVADEDLDALSERIDTIAKRRGFAGKVVLLAEPSVAAGDAGSSGPTAGWSGTAPACGTTSTRRSSACWAAARTRSTSGPASQGQRHGADQRLSERMLP